MSAPVIILLTKQQVATALGCSISQVDRLEARGVLPRRRQLGTSVRWLRTEVEAKMAELQIGSNAESTAKARAGRNVCAACGARGTVAFSSHGVTGKLCSGCNARMKEDLTCIHCDESYEPGAQCPEAA